MEPVGFFLWLGAISSLASQCVKSQVSCEGKKNKINEEIMYKRKSAY